MQLKCELCENNLISRKDACFKGLPKNGVSCNNCGAIYIGNKLVAIIGLTLASVINIILLAVMPSVSSAYTQFFLFLAISLPLFWYKPLIKKNQTSAQPIKWYTSPAFYLVPILLIALYFMFN